MAIVRGRWSVSALVALGLLGGCGNEVDPIDGPNYDALGGTDCEAMCSDLNVYEDNAACYACRCKEAMDGFLPTPQQLQCSTAERIPVFVTDLSGPEPALVHATGAPESCANPALLTESCGSDSRLGQLQEGDVHVKWICRDPSSEGVYADVAVIMHNARTGATCFFDDIDDVTTDSNIPDLDLMAAGPDNLDEYAGRFFVNEGGACTKCHDADPFIYTPLFSGLQWQTGPHALGPYSRVGYDGSSLPVDRMQLTSPEVAACTSCHRLGSAGGCEFLSPDAVGAYKTAAHEPVIHEALDAEDSRWTLGYWMPTHMEEQSREGWMQTFGTAKERLLECCAQPEVETPHCTWEPIPWE
jgi:hypothetical protein